jgi:hypothetical protein
VALHLEHVVQLLLHSVVVVDEPHAAELREGGGNARSARRLAAARAAAGLGRGEQNLGASTTADDGAGSASIRCRGKRGFAELRGVTARPRRSPWLGRAPCHPSAGRAAHPARRVRVAARPPTEAIATAISDSVTVSMGELTMGICSWMLRVTLVARLTCGVWEGFEGSRRHVSAQQRRGEVTRGRRGGAAATGSGMQGAHVRAGRGRGAASCQGLVQAGSAGAGNRYPLLTPARPRQRQPSASRDSPHLVGSEVDVTRVHDHIIIRVAVPLPKQLAGCEACGGGVHRGVGFGGRHTTAGGGAKDGARFTP